MIPATPRWCSRGSSPASRTSSAFPQGSSGLREALTPEPCTRLGTHRVLVDRGYISVASGLLVVPSDGWMGANVTGVEPRIGMQYGSRPYYDIAMLTRDGRTVLAGTGIRDKREAEGLAARMRQAMKGEAM